MVVATEFFDRRPRREPAPTRRFLIPSVQVSFIDTTQKDGGVFDPPKIENGVKQNDQTEMFNVADVVAEWEALERRYQILESRVQQEAGCTQAEAAKLLEHVPGYLLVKRAEETARSVLHRPIRMWSRRDRQQMERALAQSLTAIEQMERQVDTWETDPERMQRALSNIAMTGTSSSTTDITRTWYQELNERRAFLRAHILKAKRKLDNLTSFTPREEKIRRQLERFAPLEDFPHSIDNQHNAQALQEVLAELEPIFFALQPSLALIRTPQEEVESSPNVTPGDQSNSVSQGRAEKSSFQSKEEVLLEQLHTDPDFRPLGSELGIYEAQFGDLLYDILSGETFAVELPIANHLSATSKESVLRETIRTLDTSRALCLWIGLPYPASDIVNELHDGKKYQINMDKLHDLVTVIAADQGAIRLPKSTMTRLLQLIKSVLDIEPVAIGTQSEQNSSGMAPIESLSDLLPAIRQYFSSGKIMNTQTQAYVTQVEHQPVPEAMDRRILQLKTDVIEQHFSGNQKTFQEAAWKWAQEQIPLHKTTDIFNRPETDVCDVVSIMSPMRLATVMTLLSSNPEQRQWLRIHQISKSDWERVARMILSWKEEVKTEQCYHPSQSFADLVQIVFMFRVIESVSFSDDK